MGQQQLLLIILGVIVVGIAVAVGITMFADSATNANRDALTNDLVNLASRAQQYYRRPTSLGGGGSTFSGITVNAAGLAVLTNNASNGNGVYSIVANTPGAGTSATVEIKGVGNEIGSDGTHQVEVHVIVHPSSDSCFVKY